jgi:hypothetical protein
MRKLRENDVVRVISNCEIVSCTGYMPYVGQFGVVMYLVEDHVDTSGNKIIYAYVKFDEENSELVDVKDLELCGVLYDTDVDFDMYK